MDKEYWNNYYAKHGSDKGINSQSTFATFCQKEFFNNKSLNIVELGSGNGRDAIYFAAHEHHVVAIDQSDIAINLEKKILPNEMSSKLTAVATNFITEDYSKYGNIDVFYSRFTLHAITKEEENLIIPQIYNYLNVGSLLCIEVRTINDKLCGVGENLGDNAYYTDHYRRFIDANTFLKDILKIGFNLKYFIEKDNLSIYKEDNPVLMRIVVEK